MSPLITFMFENTSVTQARIRCENKHHKIMYTVYIVVKQVVVVDRGEV